MLCGSSLTCAAASFKASWTQLSVSTFAASGSSEKFILKRGSMKQAMCMTLFAFSVYLLRSSLITLFISLVRDGLCILFHQYITSDVVQDRLDGCPCVSEASASVNLLRGSRSWHSYSMTLMAASLCISCHVPLSPASVTQTGCCCLRKRSSILRVDPHRVTTSWIRAFCGMLRAACFSLSTLLLFQLCVKPWTR